MQNNTKWMTLLVVSLVAIVAIVTRAPSSASASTSALLTGTVVTEFNAATVYKGKCTACHGKQAEKKFDKTKTDDVLAEVILKGKDAKPLKMPAYETKGMTLEQAQALVHHMRSLNP